MTYSRFELLVLIFGGGAVLATAISAVLGNTDAVEIVAQLLLLLVLLGALHWGRRGGYIAALIAVGIYLALRLPMILAAGAVSGTLVQLLVTRAVVYGAVGIVGGEICSRIKYFFLKLEDRDYIDEVTHLYNASYLRQLLRAHIAEFDRYQSIFSIVLVRLDGDKLPPLGKQQGRSVLRDAGNALLGDIRLVDEMGRFSESVFCVILPKTPLQGGQVAAGRLEKTVGNSLRSHRLRPDGMVTTEVLGYPEDKERVAQMAALQ